MTSLASVPARLRLGRVHLATRLAMPVSSARRARRLTEADVSAALRRDLAGRLSDGDPSVWLIRRLEVGLVVDAEQDAGAALGRAVRAAVERALRGDGEGVLRFADRAEQLATFLQGLVDGDAFSHWYHARYRALAPLPLPQALRLALAGAPDEARAALLRIHADMRLAPWIEGVGEPGAGAVLSVFEARSGTAAAHDVTRQRLLALAGAEPAMRRWRTSAQGRLALSVMAAAESAAPLEAVVVAVRSALPAVVEALWPSVPGRARLRRPATETGTPDARGHGRSSRSTRTARQKDRVPDLFEALTTPFAGVFLLWRSALALGLPQMLGGPAARLHFAAALAGPDRDAALGDPALRWLAGHVPVRGDAAPRAPAPLAVARRLIEHAAPRVPALVRQRRGRVHVLQDAGSEDWLAAGGEQTIARIAEALALGPVEPASDELRPLGADLDHFARAPAWRVAARAAHADLTRRLPGLARSSAVWVARNLVQGTGTLELAEDGPRLTLPRVPLDLVLRMTGLDGTRVDLGEGRHVRLILPGPD